MPGTAVNARVSLAGLDRESLRDSTGNLVPTAILLFFALWFAVDAPWGWRPLPAAIVFGLFAVLVASLLGVTYALARAFARSESA